jgi:hypothetical protein
VESERSVQAFLPDAALKVRHFAMEAREFAKAATGVICRRGEPVERRLMDAVRVGPGEKIPRPEEGE